jgi:hypothetical protein
LNQSSSNKQALPEACFDSSDRILSLLDMEENDEAISEELSDHPYVIKEKIASGGLKSIYRAFNQQSARDVTWRMPFCLRIKNRQKTLDVLSEKLK